MSLKEPPVMRLFHKSKSINRKARPTDHLSGGDAKKLRKARPADAVRSGTQRFDKHCLSFATFAPTLRTLRLKRTFDTSLIGFRGCYIRYFFPLIGE